MSAIRSRDTKPELIVRRLAHKLGYRFRLHRRDLPGKPDLTFPARKKVIFVHGCFWHQHPEPQCTDSRIPKSNLEYWMTKLARNRDRDAQALVALRDAGWQVLTIWECETRSSSALEDRLLRFLS